MDAEDETETQSSDHLDVDEPDGEDEELYLVEREADGDSEAIEFPLRQVVREMNEWSTAVKALLRDPRPEERDYWIGILQGLRRCQRYCSIRCRKKHEKDNARSLPLPIADVMAREQGLGTALELVKMGLDLAKDNSAAAALRIDAILLLRLLSVFLTVKTPLIDGGVAELCCSLLEDGGLENETAGNTTATLQNLCFYKFREGDRNPNQRRVLGAGSLKVLLEFRSSAIQRRDGHERFQAELSLSNLLMEKGASMELLRDPGGNGFPQMALAALRETVSQSYLLNIEKENPQTFDRVFGHWIGLQSMVPLVSSRVMVLRLFGLHCIHGITKFEKYIRNGQIWRDLALNEGVQPIRRLLWEAESAQCGDAEDADEMMRQAVTIARSILEQLNAHPHEEQRPQLLGEASSKSAAADGNLARSASAPSTADQQDHEIELGAQFKVLRTDPALQALADLTLRIPGAAEDFPVHRCVMMARSPLVHRMLTSELGGGASQASIDLVELGGMSAEAVELVIEYLYTNSLALPVELAAEVLHAADVLMVPGLRLRCEELLCQYVDLESLGELLKIADTYRCQRLLQRCIAFARVHKAAWQKQVEDAAVDPLPPALQALVFEEDVEAAERLD